MQPDNNVVGIAPEIKKEAADRMEAELSQHLRECADQDESDYRRTILGLNEYDDDRRTNDAFDSSGCIISHREDFR